MKSTIHPYILPLAFIYLEKQNNLYNLVNEFDKFSIGIFSTESEKEKTFSYKMLQIH